MLGHGDPAAVAGQSLDRAVVRRRGGSPGPTGGCSRFLLVIIVLGGVLGLVPPLLFREIIDDAIPDGDRGLLTVLAALIVGAALADAGLSLVERYWSSRIGEGLIYDLRVALFDHVQRMPIGVLHPDADRRADQPHEQRRDRRPAGGHRHARLGRVERDRCSLTNVAAMVVLEWRLTLLALVLLPLFIIPAKRVGRRLQALTRERMDLNASMNTTMTERFNVSGALLVKLFGRRDARGRRVRGAGRRRARHRRALAPCTAGRSSSPSASSARSARPPSTGSAASW